nr:unnamed protein product [Spirometra erinaceieuropaei]
MFYAMLMDAYHNERLGVCVAHRIDDQFLNRWRMHYQLRVSAAIVHKRFVSDDYALNGDIQRSMNRFSDCYNFGLIIGTEKTVVMHQPPPNAADNVPQFNVSDTQLQAVDTFTYLGSALSSSIKIDDEMARWISKANQAFGRI